jgi:hypothetical protein
MVQINESLMKTIIHCKIIVFVMLSSILIGCQMQPVEQKAVEQPIEVQEESTWSAEEEEVIAMVEQLLFAVGNSDFQTLESIVSDKANLGSAIIRDGTAKNSVITITEYLESQKERERSPFHEPVNEYKILVNKGQIAMVWADATLYKYGVPLTNNIDNFTLIKENGIWKFLSISFTNTRLPDEERVFDLEIFAKSYAQVWCSKRPNFVSSFYAEDGVLQINDGAPAEGMEAITSSVKGFMDAFPDMVVTMDSLVTTLDKTQFHWTLTGTHTESGNKVHFSGYEEWTINDDGLIQSSLGHFDEKEYQRQLEFGVEK